ncbi:transcription elongation factor Spt5 [Candidatus Woesearchaeota archaeon]|nr:MAG: transcription elongation factor Spt5 [Candidatus Woesearchaeota archaeon]
MSKEEHKNRAPPAPSAESMGGALAEPTVQDEVSTSSVASREEAKERVGEQEAAAKDADIPEEAKIFAVRTTANREDQVVGFIASNAERKKLDVYAVIRPHGMRGYVFVEAASRQDVEQAVFGIPYTKGVLPDLVDYKEIEHMLDQVKKEVNIQKNDIAEIISGPFKREKCKITRVDQAKEEVVVELLEAAVPIPITVKIDAVKVIRRD